MSLGRSWFRQGESGAGTLEFALVAPALILVILAAFDFTRSLLAYTTISNGSREGARYAALHPTDARSDIERLVESRTHPLSPDALSVRVEWKYRDAGTYTLWTDSADSMPPASRQPLVVVVKVTVTYPWAATSALAGNFFPAASSSLESTSFMDMRR